MKIALLHLLVEVGIYTDLLYHTEHTDNTNTMKHPKIIKVIGAKLKVGKLPIFESLLPD